MATSMGTSEFRDLVSAVSDKMRSVKSAAGPQEKAKEICGLQGWVGELRVAKWPVRLTDADRQKALRVMQEANEMIARSM